MFSSTPSYKHYVNIMVKCANRKIFLFTKVEVFQCKFSELILTFNFLLHSLNYFSLLDNLFMKDAVKKISNPHTC